MPLALAVGVVDVANEYDQYQFEKGASGGTFDEDVALSMVDPTIAYTVLAVTGLVLDVVEVGTFLKSAAKSTKLFNTATKTVSKEALQKVNTLANAYADKLIASKKLKPENKAAFVKKLTDENVLNKNYQDFIKAKGAHMSMDDFLKAHGIPESIAISNKANIHIDITEITQAKKIAELEHEIKLLNEELSNARKAEKEIQDELTFGMGVDISKVYRIVLKSIEILRIQGRLTWLNFIQFIRKRIIGIDSAVARQALARRVTNIL